MTIPRNNNTRIGNIRACSSRRLPVVDILIWRSHSTPHSRGHHGSIRHDWDIRMVTDLDKFTELKPR